MTGFCDGNGISWTTCKQSTPGSRQITTPTPHHSDFYRPDALLLFPTPSQQCQITDGTQLTRGVVNKWFVIVHSQMTVRLTTQAIGNLRAHQ